MFQSALGMLVANIVATCVISVLGGGCSAILGFARAIIGPTLFLATVTVLSVGFYRWAIHLMSTTTTVVIMLVTPMLLPILAACFERRPADGKIVMYGSWPCCTSGTPQNPHCGAYPGIIAIVVACGLTVSRFGPLTTTLGVLYARAPPPSNAPPRRLFSSSLHGALRCRETSLLPTVAATVAASLAAAPSAALAAALATAVAAALATAVALCAGSHGAR